MPLTDQYIPYVKLRFLGQVTTRQTDGQIGVPKVPLCFTGNTKYSIYSRHSLMLNDPAFPSDEKSTASTMIELMFSRNSRLAMGNFWNE